MGHEQEGPQGMKLLRVATRRSVLALWQANHVAALLRAGAGHPQVELVPIVTEGDRRRDRPLATIGGKALFVKALEEAILDGRADLAVHSLKDVPAELPEGLALPVVLERDDPRDALLTRDGAGFTALPRGAVVGTCSLRRSAQLLAARPDLRIEMLRGNVDTRIKRLIAGDFDAIVLSAAGLDRLGLQQHISERLSPERMLPAVGQGAMAIEARADDAAVGVHLAPLNHAASATRASAERALNEALQGGCSVPVAAYAELGAAPRSTAPGTQLYLRALVASTDGRSVVRAEGYAAGADAAGLGRRVAAQLAEQGAGGLIADARAEVAQQVPS